MVKLCKNVANRLNLSRLRTSIITWIRTIETKIYYKQMSCEQLNCIKRALQISFLYPYKAPIFLNLKVYMDETKVHKEIHNITDKLVEDLVGKNTLQSSTTSNNRQLHHPRANKLVEYDRHLCSLSVIIPRQVSAHRKIGVCACVEVCAFVFVSVCLYQEIVKRLKKKLEIQNGP